MGELFYDKAEPITDLVSWVYEQGSFTPVAKLVNGERYSIVSDYIGRPVQVFNDVGEIVWETEYDIYGRLKNLKGDRAFQPFRQVGQYEDEELDGLYLNRFRFYDTNTGLYISQDPIGLWGGITNFYAYVFDTNTEIDPFGLSVFDFLKNGGLTFKQYKASRGGTKTLDFIETTNGAGRNVLQRISTEYHHMFITQRMQRRFSLPNWLVNNRVNVWRLNTIQHSILDKFRFKFLRTGLKGDVGWFKKYNFFTKFGKCR